MVFTPGGVPVRLELDTVSVERVGGIVHNKRMCVHVLICARFVSAQLLQPFGWSLVTHNNSCLSADTCVIVSNVLMTCGTTMFAYTSVFKQ